MGACEARMLGPRVDEVGGSRVERRGVGMTVQDGSLYQKLFSLARAAESGADCCCIRRSMWLLVCKERGADCR